MEKLGIEKGVFYRIGSTNKCADPLMINELRRSVSSQYFDETPMLELNPEAIDFRVASEFFREKKNFQKKDLETLGLVTKYQGKQVATVGGIILFSPLREKYFPDCWIQAGLFEGTTKSNFLDALEIHDYPLKALPKALDFIKKHSNTSFEFNALKRLEKTSLPLVAIREALINAYAHMDYSQQGAPIRISIFSDRVEIENPGILPFGLTLEELLEGVSKIRNRVIVRVLHELGYVESWGSGIQRMIQACQENGLPNPEFKEVANRFRVTLYTHPIKDVKLDKIDQEICNLLVQQGNSSTRVIAAHLNLSTRATRDRLKKLIDRGLIAEIATSPFDPNKRYISKA
jgi:predicted HTH transcriptional regulator